MSNNTNLIITLNNMTNIQIVEHLRNMNLPVIPVTNASRNILIQRIIRATEDPVYAEQVRQRQRQVDRPIVPPMYNIGNYEHPPNYVSYDIPPPGSP